MRITGTSQKVWGEGDDARRAEAVTTMVFPQQYRTPRVQSVTPGVSVLCKSCYFVIIIFNMYYAEPPQALGCCGSLFPVQGDLAVWRILPIKTKSPQPLHKDLRRRPRVFYIL